MTVNKIPPKHGRLSDVVLRSAPPLTPPPVTFPSDGGRRRPGATTELYVIARRGGWGGCVLVSLSSPTVAVMDLFSESGGQKISPVDNGESKHVVNRPSLGNRRLLKVAPARID